MPAGAPGAGRFLPKGYLGELRAERIRLLLSGQETEFVMVKVGQAEFRLRNNEASIRRWIAGAAIARAIQEGNGAAAGMGLEDVSDAVLELEADGYEGLDDFDPGESGVTVEPA